MTLPETCIKRPVFSMVLSLILIVVGLMGLLNLPTRFLPTYERNKVVIETSYPGASPQLVESNVTTPLEEAITGIAGIDNIQSDSYQGESKIEVLLKYGQPLYELANQIRNKVSEARGDLPSNIESPMVRVGGGDADLMDIAFTSSELPLAQLRDYLDRYVTNKIEQIPGVAQVYIVGANSYAMNVALDPNKMSALGISVNDVQTAIQNSNIALPAGEIKGYNLNFPITAETKINTAKQFNDLIIKNQNGRLVRISDIGKATLGTDQNNQSIVSVNGQRGIFLSINPTTNANPLETAKLIDLAMAQIKNQMPPDIHSQRFFDSSIFMKDSVREVYLSIFFATLCVIGVIALFLGSWRTMIIPIVTIPICILASFGMMYFLGFSINMITLLALVLSIGLVVDDAIVMLENIYRHIEAGVKPLTAAIKGSKEIAFAVIAMTLTLAAVYAPVGFMRNEASHIFQSFAFTLAGAVIISGFVALTLSPMMCSRLLKPLTKSDKKTYHHYLDIVFHKLQTRYKNSLHHILKHRLMIVIATMGIAVGGFFLLGSIPKAFMPEEDIGFVIGVVTASSGENAEQIHESLNQVATILSGFPAVSAVVSLANASAQGFNGAFGTLKPFAQRTMSAAAVSQAADAKIHNIPGLNAAVFPPSFGNSMKHQLAFNIMASGSYKDLYNDSQTIIKKLRQYPGLKNIDSTMKFGSQQYTIKVKREIAGRLQVSVRDIDNTLAAFFGGAKISTFDMRGKTYNVYLQASESMLRNINSISQFYVNNAQGKLIPLSSLVTVEPTLGQQDLPHYNRLRSATISAQLAPGYSFGQVVQYLQNNLPHIMPSDTKYAFIGRAERLVSSSSSMGLLFLLALVFIYLVLAAQFESFLDPFIILLAVPFSIVGALAALKLIHGSLNIYTDIGLVTLIGLIAKHGILITQFANKLQEEGVKMKDALIEAASTRLRPILMTTAAMIFGALPLVLASGASANSRMQIGIVIISGLFFGTFFSLVLVPVTYTFAAKLKSKRKVTP